MRKTIYYLLLFYVVIAVLTIIFFNGTADSGDSVYYYLFAKYAPDHPELFFDQWAKPVFVLLTAPFAQFGFTGLKVFNVIVTAITIFLTYKTAETIKIKNPILVAVIMIFTPLYYILTFSGLTEPLFALFLVVSLYLAVKQKYITVCLVLSFLPFIRSEGLIIIGVFGIFFLVKKQWKLLPYLFVGSVVYSIAGYFVYHDLLWVFTKIPYAKLSNQYGSGTPFHFVVQLFYVVGIPIYLLFWVGVIAIIFKSIKRKIILEERILIFLGFFCFFIAHSLFWYFGIFNSMGLKRVLICVMPMIAIIALDGFNFLTEDVFKEKRIPKLLIQGVLVAYILIFPFTHNPAAVLWKRDMMLSKEQQSAIAAANFTREKMKAGSRVLCSNPYLCMLLDIDCFEGHKRLGMSLKDIGQMKAGDFVLWESWFAVVESNIRKDDLDKNASLVRIYDSQTNDEGREVVYSVYQKYENTILPIPLKN